MIGRERDGLDAAQAQLRRRRRRKCARCGAIVVVDRAHARRRTVGARTIWPRTVWARAIGARAIGARTIAGWAIWPRTIGARTVWARASWARAVDRSARPAQQGFEHDVAIGVDPKIDFVGAGCVIAGAQSSIAARGDDVHRSAQRGGRLVTSACEGDGVTALHKSKQIIHAFNGDAAIVVLDPARPEFARIETARRPALALLPGAVL